MAMQAAMEEYLASGSVAARNHIAQNMTECRITVGTTSRRSYDEPENDEQHLYQYRPTPDITIIHERLIFDHQHRERRLAQRRYPAGTKLVPSVVTMQFGCRLMPYTWRLEDETTVDRVFRTSRRDRDLDFRSNNVENFGRWTIFTYFHSIDDLKRFPLHVIYENEADGSRLLHSVLAPIPLIARLVVRNAADESDEE
jgi:hypothetical protein